MNNVNVSTFLRKRYLDVDKIDQSSFFSIDSKQDLELNTELFTGDFIYIEGAVIIEIYGRKILDFEHYDYPFWFFGQFYNQVENISQGESFEIPFLETPRTLIVESVNYHSYLVKLLSLNNIDYQVSVSKRDFLAPLYRSALQLFSIADYYEKEKYGKWVETLRNLYQEFE